MPAQRTFDGDTLEAALARVTDEHGSAARILSAEKVRTGGLGGFFARERFEVLVELPEHADPTEVGRTEVGEPPAAATPRSILDLADQVSDVERQAAPSAAATVRPPSGHAPYAPSTEGRTFQEVLRGLVGEAGLTDLESERPVSDLDGRTAPPAAMPVVAPVVWPVVSTRAAPAEPPRAAPVAAPAGPPPAAPAPRADAAPAGSRPDAALLASLRALGVPQDLLASVQGTGSEAQQVLATLEQLLVPPPPLIVDRGDVVVVVGERAVAIQAAGVAAAQLGQVPGDVVVAGAGRAGVNSLRGPEEAAVRRPAWRSCSPTVVAVCANDSAAGRMWVQEMIAALEPVAVWAAVRADRKPEDVATWAAAIGGVSALAVGACAETVSPASMLGAGLPIASVEGRRSTPAAWTALLVERLAS
ncbi:MAG: hypothetical protein WD232_00165 [Acidimicrobiales bacterium]